MNHRQLLSFRRLLFTAKPGKAAVKLEPVGVGPRKKTQKETTTVDPAAKKRVTEIERYYKAVDDAGKPKAIAPGENQL